MWVSSFDDPSATVSLWYTAIGQGDLDVVRFIFDSSAIVDRIFPDPVASMTPEEKKRIEQPLIETLDRTAASFKEAVSALQTKTET